MMKKGSKGSAFLKRALTTVVGLPVVIFLVLQGGTPLLIICGLLALVGLREFYIAFSGHDRALHIIGYVFTGLYFGAIYFFGAGYWLLIALTLFIITVQSSLVIFYKNLSFKEVVSTVYGFLYVPFLFSFIVLVREHYLGAFYIWLILIAAFGCDTFAYLTGSAFGKRKLKGSPSPSKSYEGLIGGIIGATVLGLLYGLLVTHFFDTDVISHIIIIAPIVCFFGAIFSIIGDMAASAVKRFCDIKDFGDVFPGHGGVLDRVDSVIIVAPVVYAIVNIVYRLFF